MQIRDQYREFLNSIFFKFVRKLTRSNRFQAEILEIIKDYIPKNRLMQEVEYNNEIPEYKELGSLSEDELDPYKEIIFITAGFRSGSTLLWNIFRHLDGFTAYYEPLLHEKPSNRGRARNFQTDASHVGVDDYHAEFKSIPDLDALHVSDWAFKNLYMGADDFDYKLERYIDKLVQEADGKSVLQFNRADFRLAWLKNRYPTARIIHLFRNPRDQWISKIKNDVYIPREYQFTDDFYPAMNAFYLYDWWKALRLEMPFLEMDLLTHPYQIHFLLWRVSYLYGKKYSDISICFESLLDTPDQILRNLMIFLGLNTSYASQVRHLISGGAQKETWREYADEDWFKELEKQSELLLRAYFQSPRFFEKKMMEEKPYR